MSLTLVSLKTKQNRAQWPTYKIQ